MLEFWIFPIIAACVILAGFYNVFRTNEAIKLSRKYVPKVFLTSQEPWYLGSGFGRFMGYVAVFFGIGFLIFTLFRW